MKELVVLVGPPGSGKSTKAIELEKQNYTRINQDDMGKDGHIQAFQLALMSSDNIVIDRMNFNKDQRSKYVVSAKKLGFKTKALEFHVAEETCIKRCNERKNHPTIKDEETAKRAIGMFFSKYEEATKEEGFDEIEIIRDNADGRKKQALIIDIDGTMANINHRLHYVRDVKKDWGKFFSEVKGDSVNRWCAEILERFRNDDVYKHHDILFVSGRPDSTMKDTKEWLKDNNIGYDKLFMRKRDDYRKDNTIKEIIYNFNIKPYYDVLFVVDDREQVVQMWRSKGLVVLQCDEGKF